MNPKGDLIARLQALGRGTPSFEAEASGPPHDPMFRARVLVGGRALGPGGEGRSKREAERAAAEGALQELEDGGPEDDQQLPSGRWPIYAAVLAEALEVALDLADDDAGVDDVRADAARLYRDLLADLGHGPEQDE